jgi:hypothetical protein
MTAETRIPPPPPAAVDRGGEQTTSEPTRGAEKIAKTRVLTGLSCASCGGTVEVREGLTNVECRYCGTPQAVVGERGVVRLMVLNRLDGRRATEVVRSWLKKGIRKDPALEKEATIEESFLAWFPFVRARLDAVGWLLGVENRTRKRGNRTETVRVPVEHAIERSADLTMPAADMAEFGVHRVDLAGDEVLPLDDDLLRARGMVFRPSRSLQEIGDRLRDRAMAAAEREHRLDRVTFSWLAAVRRRVALVYYPMWVIRYGFRGRTYQVLIDAEDGGLAYGKAPGNHLWRAFSMVASCAGAAFVGTTVLQHADVLLRSDDGFKGLGLIGLVLAGLVYWGYRQFRHGGVVEEGTGRERSDDDLDLNESVRKFLGRIR